MYLISVLFIILMNIVFLFLSFFIYYIMVPNITFTGIDNDFSEIMAWSFLGVAIVVIIIAIYIWLSLKLLERIYPGMKNPITKIKGKRPITRKIIAEEIEEFER